MVCGAQTWSLRVAQLFVVLVLASCTESSSVAYEVPMPPAEAPLAAEVNPFIGTAGDGQTFPGAEHETQRQARLAMEGFFGGGPDGLPGNDDAGALSAWFVFSAMGFYPVTPGIPEYRLGSPLFERVTIHLSEAHHDGESFIIEALDNAPQNVFIGEANLNDHPLAVPVLPHDAITDGGSLRLQMIATPN